MRVIRFTSDYVDGCRYYKAGTEARVRDTLSDYLIRSRMALPLDPRAGQGSDPVLPKQVLVKFNYVRRINGTIYQPGDTVKMWTDVSFDCLIKYGIITVVDQAESVDVNGAVEKADQVGVQNNEVKQKRGPGRPRKEQDGNSTAS